ncbi:MAG: Flagellar basal-body rod protein FlgB [Firmicutes bacterium]|nr:Flagellar basal-body rod protein FlgB [Bacillota bacterium]MDI6704662.1 flagellar basal body rod protein FlgB [Bacillota bacterium]
MASELTGIKALEKALDAAWVRNQVISNNIANADTPNYKAYKVEFEDMLKEAIENQAVTGKRTSSKHLPVGMDPIDNVSIRISRQRNTSTRLDGNNVDIDTEMANLAKNTIKYQTLVQQLSQRLARLKTVINEGRR